MPDDTRRQIDRERGRSKLFAWIAGRDLKFTEKANATYDLFGTFETCPTGRKHSSPDKAYGYVHLSGAWGAACHPPDCGGGKNIAGGTSPHGRRTATGGQSRLGAHITHRHRARARHDRRDR